MDGRKDGWMTCDFMFFSTIFPSYQDDRRMIMNGCAKPVCNGKEWLEDTREVYKSRGRSASDIFTDN